MPAAVRKWRIIALPGALACVLAFALFDVRLRPEFSLPRDIERADPAQEARFRQCVDARTDEATRRALEFADNPDVQSLMIRMQQKEALDACRRAFPERRITVHERLRFNLVDVSFRFGDRP